MNKGKPGQGGGGGPELPKLGTGVSEVEAILAGNKSRGFIMSVYRLEENVCGYYFSYFVLYKFVCWVFVGNLCDPGWPMGGGGVPPPPQLLHGWRRRREVRPAGEGGAKGQTTQTRRGVPMTWLTWNC